MKDQYPMTCSKCGTRRDGPNSAFKDWEAARAHPEAKIEALDSLARELVELVGETGDEAMAPDGSLLGVRVWPALEWITRRNALLQKAREVLG